MDKQLTVSFKTVEPVDGADVDPKNVQVSIESSDPNDTIDDIIGLLHSTLQSLAYSVEDDEK